MPQSLSDVTLHIVFSTKNRERWIDGPILPRLHSYLATVVRNLECEAYRAGGVADHVHLAVRLARTITIAGLVEGIKTPSSAWMKTQNPRYSRFKWQRGYAAFSVSRSGMRKLLDYIDGQEKHLRNMTFQEEYRLLLKKHGVAFDERYVWD